MKIQNILKSLEERQAKEVMKAFYKDNGFLIQSEEMDCENLTTDYLFYYYITKDKKRAFQVPVLGAALIGELDKADKLLNNIKRLDSQSIKNAYILSRYSICIIKGREYYEEHDIDNEALELVNNMLRKRIENLNNANEKFCIKITKN